jgi:hypothetical protein
MTQTLTLRDSLVSGRGGGGQLPTLPIGYSGPVCCTAWSSVMVRWASGASYAHLLADETTYRSTFSMDVIVVYSVKMLAPGQPLDWRSTHFLFLRVAALYMGRPSPASATCGRALLWWSFLWLFSSPMMNMEITCRPVSWSFLEAVEDYETWFCFSPPPPPSPVGYRVPR